MINLQTDGGVYEIWRGLEKIGMLFGANNRRADGFAGRNGLELLITKLTPIVGGLKFASFDIPVPEHKMPAVLPFIDVEKFRLKPVQQVPGGGTVKDFVNYYGVSLCGLNTTYGQDFAAYRVDAHFSIDSDVTQGDRFTWTEPVSDPKLKYGTYRCKHEGGGESIVAGQQVQPSPNSPEGYFVEEWEEFFACRFVNQRPEIEMPFREPHKIDFDWVGGPFAKIEDVVESFATSFNPPLLNTDVTYQLKAKVALALLTVEQLAAAKWPKWHEDGHNVEPLDFLTDPNAPSYNDRKVFLDAAKSNTADPDPI